MYRTPSSTGNRKKFTNSFWYKRGAKLGDYQALPSVHTTESGGSFGMYFSTANVLHVFTYYSGSWAGLHYSNRVFRDVSAWYHFVWVVDTTEAIASERVRIFINGVRETSWSSESYPSLNQDTSFNNSGEQHNVGKDANGSYYVDGYGAEMHYIDGYSYDPEYFGEFDENGIWIPKKYTESYGTNGFYIKGSDSGSLGTDSSGNGNNLTVSGLASNDQKIDTPTNNQITFNPLNNQRSGGNPQNGNLQYDGPGTRTVISLTANIPSTGKWAVAFSAAAVSTNAGWQFGVTKANNTNFGDAAGSNEDIGGQDNDGIQMSPSSSDLQLYDYTTSTSIDPSLPITTSDEFWLAVDMATGKCFLGIYDESATTMKFVAADTGLDGNPATGDNPSVTISAMIGSNDYTFAAGSKDTSNDVTLLRSTEVSGTTPTGYTYFENVKDLI